MLEAMGGRKFLMVILMLGVGMGIEILGKNGLSTTMAGLIMGLYTAFSAANVVATVKAAKTEGQEEPTPATPVDLSKTEAALSHLIERNAALEQAAQTMQTSQASIQKALATLITLK